MTLFRSILGLKPIYPTAWCKFMGLLLKTGQTTQYSSKEDDGYFKKGLARDYTVLTAEQYSGTTEITLNAKTHNLSNNCVMDNRTGLMWARYVPVGDIGPDSNGKLLWLDDVNDEDIFDFADEANAQELGGHDDWRVPNLLEAVSLIETFQNPAIDGVAFPSSPSDSIWTSTTNRATTTDALRVYLGIYPATSTGTKTTGKYYCRLVRGG